MTNWNFELCSSRKAIAWPIFARPVPTRSLSKCWRITPYSFSKTIVFIKKQTVLETSWLINIIYQFSVFENKQFYYNYRKCIQSYLRHRETMIYHNSVTARESLTVRIKDSLIHPPYYVITEKYHKNIPASIYKLTFLKAVATFRFFS